MAKMGGKLGGAKGPKGIKMSGFGAKLGKGKSGGKNSMASPATCK